MSPDGMCATPPDDPLAAVGAPPQETPHGRECTTSLGFWEPEAPAASPEPAPAALSATCCENAARAIGATPAMTAEISCARTSACKRPVPAPPTATSPAPSKGPEGGPTPPPRTGGAPRPPPPIPGAAPPAGAASSPPPPPDSVSPGQAGGMAEQSGENPTTSPRAGGHPSADTTPSDSPERRGC